MNIQTCEYNEDNGSINVILENGQIVSLLCNEIEAQLNTNIVTSSRLEWLKENDLISYADMVLSGEMQTYLDQYLSGYREEKKTIRKQMEQVYDKNTADEITNEFMMYRDRT
jgi:hypothetical protein